MKIFTITKNKGYLIGIIFWIVVWQLVSMKLGQEILLVSPVSVIKRLFQLSVEAEFWIAISHTFIKIVGGFFIAFILGIIVAIIAYYNKFIKFLIEPLVLTVQSIPVASFIILCLVWISSKDLSIFISFLMVFPIIYRNVINGIKNIPKGMEEMATVFKVTKFKKIRYIYLSYVIPYIKSACNISLGLCWKAGIAAEVIGIPSNTIGEKLYNAKIYLDTPDLFAWTLVIIIISFAYQKVFILLIDYICDRLETR